MLSSREQRGKEKTRSSFNRCHLVRAILKRQTLLIYDVPFVKITNLIRENIKIIFFGLTNKIQN